MGVAEEVVQVLEVLQLELIDRRQTGNHLHKGIDEDDEISQSIDNPSTLITVPC